jgi:two-component system, chemotaxis family, sensor kinase CheA
VNNEEQLSADLPDEVMAIFRGEASDLLHRALAALNRAANAQGADRQKQIKEIGRLLHTLKGAAAAVGHEPIQSRTHSLEDRILELPADAPAQAFSSLFAALEGIEQLMAGTAPAAQEAQALPAPVREHEPPRLQHRSAPERSPAQHALLSDADSDAKPAYAEWLRIAPERVDQLHAQLGELTLARLQNDHLVDRMIHIRKSAAESMTRQRDLARMLTELRKELSPESYRRLRLSTQALAHGWNGVFEGLQVACRDARVLQTQSSVLSRGVEESIQDLRLMALTPFFEGFAKSARESARRAHKQVRFHVQAEGAEVDRTVLTRLSEALLHLVRNAVVHGIEPANERVAQGKASEGNLTLEAWADGTHAVIRVIDDGAGVDVQRVQAKARALGLTASEDVLDTLTHPGFSTRDSADELAGRGVGLDVVAHIVRELDGSLELFSERGRGTTFTIRVPIAASTIMGLILEVGAKRFGVMLSAVESVIRPALSDIQRVEGRAAVRVGDEMVAVVTLAELLGIEEQALSARVPVVILQQARRRLGLLVGEIPGEHPLVVRALGRAFRGLDMFVGGAVQPDHSVVPVLNTSALFARAARTTRSTTLQKAQLVPARTNDQLHALVVDDSITMRTMIRNVLSAAGYHVVVAEDGKAALATLEQMPECHIVVTDLQMPRMDGIELCRAIRGREGPYVPIVMVTSVDDDSEKSRALSAGADAYVVKASFEQTSFLSRIDTLVRGPV